MNRPQSAPSSGYGNNTGNTSNTGNGSNGNSGTSGGGGGGTSGGGGNKKNLPVCRLEVLLLGFNRIVSMEDLDLERFPNLRVLHLQSNQLTSLHVCSPPLSSPLSPSLPLYTAKVCQIYMVLAHKFVSFFKTHVFCLKYFLFLSS